MVEDCIEDNEGRTMFSRFHWSEFALWGVALIAVALAAVPAFA